jgi:hypothetical protein
MTDNDKTHRYGLLQSAMEEFLQRTRALASLAGSVGGDALGALPEPVPATVNRMLKSLHQLSEVAPPLTAEFEVLVEQLHAQRLTVQALQSELSAYDHQLEVLEKSLAPLENWAHQWARLRQSLDETLHSTVTEPDSETD